VIKKIDIEKARKGIKHVLSIILDEYLERNEMNILVRTALDRKGIEVIRVTSEHIQLNIPMFQYLKIKEFSQGRTSNGNYWISLSYEFQSLDGGSNSIHLVDIRFDGEWDLNSYWVAGDEETYWVDLDGNVSI
jgi:hypothetical protein